MVEWIRIVNIDGRKLKMESLHNLAQDVTTALLRGSAEDRNSLISPCKTILKLCRRCPVQKILELAHLAAVEAQRIRGSECDANETSPKTQTPITTDTKRAKPDSSSKSDNGQLRNQQSVPLHKTLRGKRDIHDMVYNDVKQHGRVIWNNLRLNMLQILNGLIYQYLQLEEG